jgi:murein DD-endopeptidase MepM/ murein hydrolase activator NlpD
MFNALISAIVTATMAATSPSHYAGARYQPPVSGPIVEHFRPPACQWCPGNRGIDYNTDAGEVVRASQRGVVTFAGQVGGDLFVVVAHPDGLRTTYAYLSVILVAVGESVVVGQVLGTAGPQLHFGVRRGDRYLDPELLLSGALQRAVLVPMTP